MSGSATPPRLSVSVGVQSHPGKVRAENQDRVSRTKTAFGDLYLLADGVGGQRGGAEAAQYVVDAFVSYLARPEQSNPVQALQEAALHINSDLNRGIPAGAVAGMSSTVVLALIQGSHAIIGHTGDSRAYLLRGGQLKQLTRDHSVMQRLISEHHLSPEEARAHPDASVLTQALGQRQNVELETLEFELVAGDALLLCSDGLWAYTTPGEIQTIAGSPSLAPQAVAEALLNLALNNGGGDNISLQFLRFADNAAVAGSPSRAHAAKGAKLLLFVACAAILLLAAGAVTIANLKHPIASARLPPISATPAPAAPPGSVRGSHRQTPVQNFRGVQVVLLSFPQARPVDWQQKIKTLDAIEVIEQSGGNACRQLLRAEAKLYYAHPVEAQARRIQTSLNIPSAALVGLNPDELSPCTRFLIVAVPPAAASVVQDVRHRANQLKNEFEKHSPINGVPTQPPQLPIPKL